MIKIVSIIAYSILFLLFVFVSFFAIKLGNKNFWSLRSFAIFYPAITGLLVSSYYIVKDVFTITDKKTTSSREFIQIYKDSDKFKDNLEQVMVYSRVLDNNINTKKFRGYINAYFKSIKALESKIKINNETAFYIVESVFLESILNQFSKQWINISGKEQPQFNIKTNIKELKKKIKSTNNLFDFKLDKIYLPQGSTIEYTRVEQSSSKIDSGLLEISSIAFSFKIRISPFGIDNFNPKYNDFDRFTLDLNTNYDANFQYKKYIIHTSLEIYKESHFTEDHELLNELLNEITNLLDREFSWSSLKEQLIFQFNNKLYNNEHFQTTEDSERKFIIQKLLNLDKDIKQIYKNNEKTFKKKE